MTLFRPIGLHELGLIWDAGMREFPPRLPHQPIFYPVAKASYARQIAQEWNVSDANSAFAGLVTSFDVDADFLSNFVPHKVGSSEHAEYWIPANVLGEFNAAIRGTIRVQEGFFGKDFAGHIPDYGILKGKDAVTQLITLHRVWEYSNFDVNCEVSANRKTIFLNWLFWSQHDFSIFGVNHNERDIIRRRIKECWKFNRIEISLPA